MTTFGSLLLCLAALPSLFPADSARFSSRPLNMPLASGVALGASALEYHRTSPDPLPFADSLIFLSPGDQLLLRWWGTGEGQRELSVGSNYDLVIPDVGRIHVKGLDLEEVRDSVERRLRQVLRPKIIDLQILGMGDAQVRISGFAPNSGLFFIPAGTPLSQVLPLAGITPRSFLHQSTSSENVPGTLPGMVPSMRQILLIRPGKDTARFDLARALNAGDASQDPPLFTGDHLVLIPRGSTVVLHGAVPHPGRFEVLPDETVSSALLAAGLGPSRDSISAVTTEGTIQSITHSARLDPRITALHLPDPSPFKPIPVVWVLGMVKNPGPISLSHASTTEEAIRAAGGRESTESGIAVSIKRNWQHFAAVRRPEAFEGIQYPEVRMALSAYVARMRGNYSDPRSPLHPGDTVWVHETEQIVWVSGAVRKPGFVPWKQGASIDDYVDAAGGYAERPWKDRTVVYDLYTDQLLHGQPVRPGSAIVVPEKQYIYPLTWFSTIATSVSLLVAIGSLAITAANTN